MLPCLLSTINSSRIPLFLHAIDEWATLTMLSTECRQLVRHHLATFMDEHAFALIVDFERCTTPAVKDGIATKLLYHHEMSQARDFAQGMRLFAVAWHGLSDEQRIGIAVINGKGDTVVDVTLLLTHDTHTFFQN
jgi:hypothetical protein